MPIGTSSALVGDNDDVVLPYSTIVFNSASANLNYQQHIVMESVSIRSLNGKNHTISDNKDR
jgi:hypothetical protein